MTTLFYRNGREVPATEVRAELNESARDAGVPIEMAQEVFIGACAGDACDQELIENLIPGLACVTQIGFGT
jgi:hypothetical protein